MHNVQLIRKRPLTVMCTNPVCPHTMLPTCKTAGERSKSELQKPLQAPARNRQLTIAPMLAVRPEPLVVSATHYPNRKSRPRTVKIKSSLRDTADTANNEGKSFVFVSFVSIDCMWDRFLPSKGHHERQSLEARARGWQISTQASGSQQQTYAELFSQDAKVSAANARYSIWPAAQQSQRKPRCPLFPDWCS